MIATLIICFITIFMMIASILFFPHIKIGKIKLDSYWVITLLGISILLISGLGDAKSVLSSLFENNAINPIKILVLFISMSFISIYLDELGFFKYLATLVLKKAKTNQVKLFIYLYVIVSILTVFTSNDIIILSFTPFICYFAKNAKINPIPFLITEFVAANTWSMALVIGNPTNVYLSTYANITFVEYLKVMILPTVACGVVSLVMLYIMNRKKLLLPMNNDCELNEKGIIKDKTYLIIGLVHLVFCTIMLAISSYIGVEMWLVSAASFVSLIVCSTVASIIKKDKPTILVNGLARAPWQLIPFVLSMFAMIIVVSSYGLTDKIASLLGESATVLNYGASSFLTCNVINNIPMSVLFSKIIEAASPSISTSAIYSTIIGSNLGALFTPIGALAGIMWSNILVEHDYKFGYLDFLKTGIIVAIPALAATLGILFILL